MPQIKFVLNYRTPVRSLIPHAKRVLIKRMKRLQELSISALLEDTKASLIAGPNFQEIQARLIDQFKGDTRLELEREQANMPSRRCRVIVEESELIEALNQVLKEMPGVYNDSITIKKGILIFDINTGQLNLAA